MKAHKMILSFCLLIVLSLAACVQNAAVTPVVEPVQAAPVLSSPTPTAQTLAPFDHLLTETACPMTLTGDAVEGENIICYTIAMPEIHEQPGAASILLTVAVVKSRSQPPQPDPLFMLVGGPGQSALKTFIPILFSSLGENFRAHRDVILVEQRGTLYASPYLHCEEIAAMELEVMGRALDTEERQVLFENNLKSCYMRLSDEGINLSAFNSLQNAADVAAIVRTLDYDTINLYGGSYGTMLAQHLMRDYPQLIRSVVLDSVAPLRHEPNVLHKAASFDRSLRLLFAQCVADPACAKAYPDLENRFFQTVAELNRNPVTVDLTHPQTNVAYPLHLSGDKLVEITRSYLYLTPLLPSLPNILAGIADGQYDTLATIQSMLVFDPPVADGMYKSVVCSEIVDFTTEDFSDSAELYPDVVRVMNNMLGEMWVDTCEIWDVAKLEPQVKTSVESDIPTLMLSGEFDPTTPPALTDIAAEKLGKSYSVTFPATSHGVLVTSQCATAIMLGFYENPSIQPDAQCVEDLPSLVFDVPDTTDAAVSLIPVTVETKGIESVVPENWSELQPGLFVRGKSALDQTLMIFDVVPGQSPDVFVPGLLNFLNIAEFPGESTNSLVNEDMKWDLYRIESSANGMETRPAVALGQDAANAYVVVLMVNSEEAEFLFEAAFLPAVKALKPVN